MPLDRYAVLSNALIAGRSCLGITDCEYDTFVSLGDPPQDCSQLTGRYIDSRIRSFEDAGNCWLVSDERFEIILTRCCLTNIGDDFDPLKEDSDARCFLDDFGTLFDCLACYLGNDLPKSINCRDQYVTAGTVDESVQGGCYTGRVSFGFSRMISCCAIPDPTP